MALEEEIIQLGKLHISSAVDSDPIQGTGNFTSSSDLNLIIAKCTRIEIHLMTPEGLVPQFDLNIYGRISVMELYRPQGASQDYLFLATERYQFCVLAFDSKKGEILTKAHGNVKDRIAKATEGGHKGTVDPNCRMIGLHLYDGYFKIIPMTPDGNLEKAFNVRLEELQVIDIKFLHGCRRPTICVLYQDHREARHIKTYEVMANYKDLGESPWQQPNVEHGASMLIPVPEPYGGVIVVGQQTITYHSGSSFKAVPIPTTFIKAYGQVDKDGSRFLLADHYGGLHVVVLEREEQQVVNIYMENLGTTSCASTVSYLDNGVVFVGSSFGDSQLIKLNRERDESGSYVQVLDVYTSLGPIVDFCVMDLDRHGQGQIVTCSGAYKDGSLRVIRNGIGINEQATVELPGIKGMWSLRPTFAAEFDKFLVQSFTSEIRVLGIEGEEMEEVEIDGFDDKRTLCCGNMVNDLLLQVTETSARLVDCSSLKLVQAWTPPEGTKITVASCNSVQLVVATGGGHLVYLEVEGQRLVEKSHVELEYEVSCIDLTPMNGSQAERSRPGRPNSAASDGPEEGKEIEMTDAPLSEGQKSNLVAVGMWTEISVRLFSLPSLEERGRELLGGETLPRSVLFSTFDGAPHLLVGLGDGLLLYFRVDIDSAQLSKKRRVFLGTQPVILAPFRSGDTVHVFAACDRPTVLYSSNGKILFSNVNTSETNFMCPFNSESFPESLALASEEELMIATIDDIQKLHIRSIPLSEQPRRIAHVKEARALVVCCVRYSTEQNGEETETNFVRLFDDQTFESVMSYELDPFENACSTTTVKFADDSEVYVAVGTAYTHPEEAEPMQGRVLVFSISGSDSERKLRLVCEQETRGAVYCLKPFGGKLLAGVNSKVQLFRWVSKDEGERELQSECSHHGHIIALYLQTHGDFIVVGDLMKSISLLLYKSIDGTIEEVARDYNANWMTAVGMLSDDVFIGAETYFNLFTLKFNNDAIAEEERGRLVIQGEYHLGEFVNVFQKGSLVMQPTETESSGSALSPSFEDSGRKSAQSKDGAGASGSASPTAATSRSLTKKAVDSTVLFGTVNGVIGVIASISESHYRFLKRIETALTKVIRGIGGLSHSEWRAFESERKTAEASNFVDGDLVESFLDLPTEKAAEIVKLLNADDAMEDSEPITVEELSKQIEEMARIH